MQVIEYPTPNLIEDLNAYVRASLTPISRRLHLKPIEESHIGAVLVHAASNPGSYALPSMYVPAWYNSLVNRLRDMEETPFSGMDKPTWEDMGNALLFQVGFFPDALRRKGERSRQFFQRMGVSAYYAESDKMRNVSPSSSERLYELGEHFDVMVRAITEIKLMEEDLGSSTLQDRIEGCLGNFNENSPLLTRTQ